MSTHNKISTWRRINRAVIADKKNFPAWPDHVVAQAAKVAAASGDLLNLSLSMKYEKDKPPDEHIMMDMEAAAITTIVQAFRFLENLNKTNNGKQNRMDGRNLESTDRM